MTANPIFRGVGTALVTPLTPAGVDYEAFGRLIDWHAARLQVQERLVDDIVRDITEELSRDAEPPLGVALFMEGEHLCKTMRGAKKEGTMSCTCLTGIFKDDPQARAEFIRATQQ